MYAFSVSGFSSTDCTIFKINVVGANLLTGGSFGPEGGLLATLVLIIEIIIFTFDIIEIRIIIQMQTFEKW